VVVIQIGVIKFEIKLFNRKKKKRFRSLIVKNVLTAQGLNISLKKLNLHKSWTIIGTQLIKKRSSSQIRLASTP
jgi:hypothetical protein